MKDDAAKAEPSAAADEKAKRKAKGERYTQIMWAYVCGAITLIDHVVGAGFAASTAHDLYRVVSRVEDAIPVCFERDFAPKA